MVKELIFIHIPKTGGTSIVKRRRIKVLGHMPTHINPINNHINRFMLNIAVKLPDFYKYNSFAVVRHPYTRFQSAYSYILRGGSNEIDEMYKNWLLSYPNLDNILDDLSELKKKIVHFVEQHLYITDSDGTILVAHIVHFENLQNELEEIEPSFANLPHLNQSESDKIILTERQKAKIYEAYKKDFEIFNYEP